MARKKQTTSKPGADMSSVEDYRHRKAKRKNNPPAKIAAEGTVPLLPKAEYFYSLRRPPVLRFDADALRKVHLTALTPLDAMKRIEELQWLLDKPGKKRKKRGR